MPPDPKPRPPKKLSIALQSGDMERVHYGFVMASSAAAIGVPVTLFFTMGACRALLRETPPELIALDADYAPRGIGTFAELLDACVELGVRFMVCEMGLVARDIEAADLRTDVPVEVTGFVSFLMDAGDDGQIVFV